MMKALAGALAIIGASPARFHGFGPHYSEPVVNKAGKQLGGEPMGQAS